VLQWKYNVKYYKQQNKRIYSNIRLSERGNHVAHILSFNSKIYYLYNMTLTFLVSFLSHFHSLRFVNSSADEIANVNFLTTTTYTYYTNYKREA